ncbi:hypothetical protein LguiB_027083 [Lonicera macranthoides]
MASARFICVILVSVLFLLEGEVGSKVPITRLESAVKKGAVCLDGSPPAYHFDKGTGKGANSWLVHLEALLSGNSAGGLASIIHCDKFRAFLPFTSRVKCFSDAGFFMHAWDYCREDLFDAKKMDQYSAIRYWFVVFAIFLIEGSFEGVRAAVSIDLWKGLLVMDPISRPIYVLATDTLSRKKIEEIYGTRHIGRDQARGLVGLMDFFCFSEAYLRPPMGTHIDPKPTRLIIRERSDRSAN